MSYFLRMLPFVALAAAILLNSCASSSKRPPAAGSVNVSSPEASRLLTEAQTAEANGKTGKAIKIYADLVKEYPSPGGALRVLDSLSFEVDGGESLAVSGPSGSGKSTLLNLLGALDRPTSGEIVFDGEAVHELEGDRAAAFRNRKAGFVFQDHHLLPQLTAAENVLLPRLAEGAAGAKDLVEHCL